MVAAVADISVNGSPSWSSRAEQRQDRPDIAAGMIAGVWKSCGRGTCPPALLRSQRLVSVVDDEAFVMRSTWSRRPLARGDAGFMLDAGVRADRVAPLGTFHLMSRCPGPGDRAGSRAVRSPRSGPASFVRRRRDARIGSFLT